MEKLSRTKKYQGLRDRLQNDSESQVVSKDLSQFQDRLNRLDVMQFDSAKESDEHHDPIHARRNSYFEEPAVLFYKRNSHFLLSVSYFSPHHFIPASLPFSALKE